MSRRLRFLLAAALVVLAILSALRARGPRFHALANGQEVAPGWTVVVDDRGASSPARYRYGLRDANGKDFPLEELSDDDLTVAVVSNAVIATRYFGSGSSGATYYSLYRLTPVGPRAIPAVEVRDWGIDDRCRDAPTVQSPPKDPSTVFGACPDPEWSDNGAVFRLPGFHCSRWQTGGCPIEHVVRW